MYQLDPGKVTKNQIQFFSCFAIQSQENAAYTESAYRTETDPAYLKTHCCASKKDKLLAKLCASPSPRDFPWHDLISLMSNYGFKSTCSGGSHYTFEHTSGFRFSMSKTHPSGILKTYQVRDAKNALRHIEVIL
jgi:predicted RNA binding protein YcfA (HicA-like mRNA interferase family)